jgi:hypothetical protein
MVCLHCVYVPYTLHNNFFKCFFVDYRNLIKIFHFYSTLLFGEEGWGNNIIIFFKKEEEEIFVK